MGKKKAPEKQCEEMPGWLITFSDMMTLMLTFFVLLVSMATVDEHHKLVVLGSIIGTFGWADQSYEVLSRQPSARTVEPGPMETGDLEPLKPLLWEDSSQDLRFQSNRFLQILSINADVLFEPNSTTLSPSGRALLDRILPVLLRVSNPVLVAGHSSILRDELGREYQVGDEHRIPDPSWNISLGRAMAVYLYLVRGGMDTDMLRMEAFGRFSPRNSPNTPEGRRMNRSVDIVLDKRNEPEAREIERLQPRETRDDFDYEGFRFNLDTMPERE